MVGHLRQSRTPARSPCERIRARRVQSAVTVHDVLRLREVTLRRMQEAPGYWQRYYHGAGRALSTDLQYSLSDRIRYYWTQADAVAAVERLLARLDGVAIPETLVSQYLAGLYPEVAAGRLVPEARALCLAAVERALAPYRAAVTGEVA